MSPLQRKILVLSAVAVVSFAAAAGALWWLVWRPVRYINAHQGYSIRFPDGWEVLPGGAESLVQAGGFQDPKDNEPEAIISIITADLKSLPAEGKGIAWWSPLSATRLENFTRLREGNWRFPRHDVPWVEFTYLGPEKTLVQGWQFYLREEPRGYVVTCTAKPAAFEKYRTEFERSIRSFRFE
ncbi:MAG TPA: hypothetical protein VK661_12135 [Planctomycetota bacterium]|jgi:hypothetical protein|nr:hypothetical protein [Planctomycetota bacterium]